MGKPKPHKEAVLRHKESTRFISISYTSVDAMSAFVEAASEYGSVRHVLPTKEVKEVYVIVSPCYLFGEVVEYLQGVIDD